VVAAMTSAVLFAWLATCIPLIGALAGRMLWEDAPQLKKSCIIWSLISVAPILKLNMNLPEGSLLLALLPIVTTISLLGQPVQKDHRLSWLMTLVCLGLGIGVLAHPAPLGHLFLLALLATMTGLLMRHHTSLWPISWWGIGLFCLAAIGVLVTVLANPPLSPLGTLVTAAVLIPLLPFHTGYVTALTRLPGNLPSFSAFLLPAVGLHVMASALQTVPRSISGIVGLFALIGALYGAVKALAQTRIRLMLSYAGLSFCSMLWWHTAASGLATSRAAVFIASIGLATCGLLIAWQVIRTRYGDDVDPSSISGLASSMPRYAVLLSLLALAAMGLPPFGVFAGLMGLLLHSPIPSLIGLMIMLSSWLAASWYLMSAVQRLLFGTRRSDLRYRDVVQQEWAALTLTIVVLTVLGLAPIEWWTSTTTQSVAGTSPLEIP
jgi:NADH-quinone oxidoreductase subunit M